MGFIKIERSILKWGWYKDPATKVVFLHLLLNANYEDGEFLGEKIKAGQVVFGRKKYAQELGLSEQNVRTAMAHLHKTGEISTSKVTNKFTVITIEKWSEYQGNDVESNQQDNQQLTNDQPTTNHIQERKNKRNNNNNRQFENEFAELWDLYPKKQGRKDALRHYKAARKRGTTYEQVKAGILAYKNYVEKTGTDMQYVKQGSSFFNQEAWGNDWTVHEQKPKPRSNVPAQPEPPRYKPFEPEPERKPEPMTEEQRRNRDRILRGVSDFIKEA